jgi:hypothetical protein
MISFSVSTRVQICSSQKQGTRATEKYVHEYSPSTRVQNLNAQGKNEEQELQTNMCMDIGS